MSKSPWENPAFANLSLQGIDKRFLAGTSQEVNFLEKEMGLSAPAKLLDLGCGAGRHSIELAKRGHIVVGIDVSAPMLAEARARATEANVTVQFLQIDIAHLAEELDGGGGFEGAICLCESGLGVLGGEKQDIKFLSSVYHLLLPGSSFVMTTFNALRKYRNPSSAFDYLRGIVHWQGPPDDKGTLLREDQRIYSPSELCTLLLLAGFEKISVWGCSPGKFSHRKLGLDDIEMLAVARKVKSNNRLKRKRL